MIQKVASYIRSMLPEQFRNWTEEALEDYVVFHLNQNTMVVGESKSGVCGVLIAWGQDEPHQVPFTWQKHKPDAPYYWFDQLAAKCPIVVFGLVHKFAGLHPRFLRVPILGIRNGKPRAYLPGKILKLYKKGFGLYGNEG